VTVDHGTIEIMVPRIKPGDASPGGAMRGRPAALDKGSGEFTD
jgi:hypothetical protein